MLQVELEWSYPVREESAHCRSSFVVGGGYCQGS